MGFSGINFWQLAVILIIVVLLFGTKRLGSLGSDLGKMIKGFKSSMNDDDDKTEKQESAPKSVDDKSGATTNASSSEKTEHKH